MKMQEQTISAFDEVYADVQPNYSIPIKTINGTKFLNYIQTYRAMAAICVVAVHCTALLTNAGKSIEGILFQRSTHMFVVMAGFVFQHLINKFKWKKYYVSKLRNVILPYLLLSFPLIFYRVFIVDKFFLNNPLLAVKTVLYYLVTGNHLLTFWFIPTIFLFYAIAPLLVLLDKDGRIYLFLPLLILLSFYINRANEIVVNPILMFVHFFSVYVTGMFLSRHRERVFELTDKYIYYLVIFVASLFVYQYLYSYWYEQMQYIQKATLSVLLLYVFRKYDNYVPSQINIIARMSFGIYLIHGLVVFGLGFLFKRFVNGGHLVYNLQNYIFIFLLIMTVTIIFIKVVKLITKNHSRKFVGC
jgi:surface polysaccharide O-acyltransferase-like enzyme